MTENRLRLGIVGHGFVGKAVDYAFSTPLVDKFIVDPKYGTDISGLVAYQPNVTFVCAPTPMNEDGTVDASIVSEAVKELLRDTSSFIVIKSTITPMEVDKLAQLDNRIIYNPEFLQEGNSKADFIRPNFHIVGSSHASATQYFDGLMLNYSLCDPAPTVMMTPVEASYVKYAINSFLAMKVTFFNELAEVIERFGGNAVTISRAISSDRRIGGSHTKVPGYDGKKGFGGACFPKDVSAFIEFAETMGVSLELLKTTMEVNNKIRSAYELDEREKANNVNYGQAKEEQ